MKKGDRVKLLGLPTGSGLPRKLIGREGVIIHTVSYMPGTEFHQVQLDPVPRERMIKTISGVHPKLLELIK